MSLVVWLLLVVSEQARAATWAPDAVDLGYYGDFITHPGLAARAGWQLNRHERAQVLLEVEAGTFWHPNNQVAVFLRTGPGIRWWGKRGGSYGAFVHLGYQHGFFAVPTYTVEGGEATRTTLAGDSWMVGAAGLELGHRVRTQALSAWYLRPQGVLTLPTFHGVGYTIALEGGVRL